MCSFLGYTNLRHLLAGFGASVRPLAGIPRFKFEGVHLLVFFPVSQLLTARFFCLFDFLFVLCEYFCGFAELAFSGPLNAIRLFFGNFSASQLV